MKKPITFIHTADLHLDSPFIGLKHLPRKIFNTIKESTFLSFSKLVTHAINKKVDFVLIAGDLYDSEDRSLKAQLTLKREFERLKEEGIQVFIIHGNHDHLGGQWLNIDWPDNVHVFKDGKVERKTFSKSGQQIAYIYGSSYLTRSVRENMTSYYKKENNDSVYHIGMLHGSLEGNKEHDVYSPFKLNELIERDFDYWALGHIHKRQLLHDSPVIAYPGNIQGRHRKEIGEKGFLLVEMEDEKVSTQFLSTEEVIWEEVELDINELQSVTELIQKCEEIIAEFYHKKKSTCLTISFSGSSLLSEELNNPQTIQYLTDTLNDRVDEDDLFIWIVKLVNKTHNMYKANDQLHSFFNDLRLTIKSYQSFEDIIKPLSQHPVYRKYITEFTTEEREQLLKGAEKLLHNQLLKSEVKKS